MNEWKKRINCLIKKRLKWMNEIVKWIDECLNYKNDLMNYCMNYFNKEIRMILH